MIHLTKERIVATNVSSSTSTLTSASPVASRARLAQPAAVSSPAAATKPFERFVDALTALVSDTAVQTRDEHALMLAARSALDVLIATDTWLPPAYAVPSEQRYQQYLLYADPLDRFSVVSFVWGPGQSTPIHNHTVWGLIGMLRGAERSQTFHYQDDGHLVPGPETVLYPGDIDIVSPTLGDIHRVSNLYPDQVSVSIHVYGADIGKVSRSVFSDDGTQKQFISGYSNGALPSLVKPITHAYGKQAATSEFIHHD